jgi:uncharacterized DUF497 family protein/uncharacterized protein (DUF4415 family)
MAYDWDEEKRKANIAAHKIDFVDAAGFDWDHAVIEIDDRKDYGELRECATGFIGATLCVLVFTRRDEHIRIISMRKATKKGSYELCQKSKNEYKGKGWAEARAKALKYAEGVTDEEDAALTCAAVADADNPPLTNEDFTKMRPAVKAVPEIVARHRGQRGPQKSKPVKTQLTLRLDPDVVEHFKAFGPGWTARINEVLRKAAGLKKRA